MGKRDVGLLATNLKGISCPQKEMNCFFKKFKDSALKKSY
jgi:hypothetical protein